MADPSSWTPSTSVSRAYPFAIGHSRKASRSCCQKCTPQAHAVKMTLCMLPKVTVAGLCGTLERSALPFCRCSSKMALQFLVFSRYDTVLVKRMLLNSAICIVDASAFAKLTRMSPRLDPARKYCMTINDTAHPAGPSVLLYTRDWQVPRSTFQISMM